MRTPPVSLTFRTFSIVSLLLFSPPVAWGYRPFVSTDAAVADLKEMEIELGYFNLDRERGRNTFIVPKVVLNYGLIQNLELVGEFGVAEPSHGSVRLTDPSLSLKAVLKEGVLQEKSGVSFAVEAGPLLPSTNREENKFGFEASGILSGKLDALTYHVNFGGGVDRAQTNPFIVWGVIAELPITPKLRLVGEINGETVKRNIPDNSALVGFIWEAPWQKVFIDAGVRRGISRAAPDWMFTTGLTFSFSLATIPHN
ncbi:MAG: hypothetical protein E6J74_31590 [Deltaproteobacteria bacterium]|nr:MAG: hypothetical protein E6J74_31590 [Deltaproteobacteria bacterium]